MENDLLWIIGAQKSHKRLDLKLDHLTLELWGDFETGIDIDVLGVVENMSYFVGDDGKEYDIFGRGGARGAGFPQ